MAETLRTTAGRGAARTAGALALAAASIAASGCLVKDVSEIWYVDGAGAVTWIVQETNVRSDANAAIDRQDEENVYWLAVQQERHPVAAGLREIGGSKVRTLVLRGEVPFTVRTEAKFSGLDDLGQRIIAASGGSGSSIITRDGLAWEWTMVVRDPSAMGTTNEPSDNVTALMEHLDDLQVLLVTGRFESAEGFSLSSDRRAATFSLKETMPTGSEDPTVTLRLKWKGGA